MSKAPYIRYKDYDHEDVEINFVADRSLLNLSNALTSLGVLSLLVWAINMLEESPESWLSTLILKVWGL